MSSLEIIYGYLQYKIDNYLIRNTQTLTKKISSQSFSKGLNLGESQNAMWNSIPNKWSID